MSRRAEHRRRATGRRESGSFIAVPHAILESDAYRTLGAHAVKLLFDLASQFRGSNNGDLSAAWRIMQPRNWRSRETLSRALHELQAHGLIEKTRQAIDACDGKLDAAPTYVASGRWRTWNVQAAEQNASTPCVSARHAQRVNDAQQAA